MFNPTHININRELIADTEPGLNAPNIQNYLISKILEWVSHLLTYVSISQ